MTTIKGSSRVVMTGSPADDEAWHPHIRNKQLSDTRATRGVIDIFAAVGLNTHDISIPSDEFVDEVRGQSVSS